MNLIEQEELLRVQKDFKAALQKWLKEESGGLEDELLSEAKRAIKLIDSLSKQDLVRSYSDADLVPLGSSAN